MYLCILLHTVVVVLFFFFLISEIEVAEAQPFILPYIISTHKQNHVSVVYSIAQRLPAMSTEPVFLFEVKIRCKKSFLICVQTLLIPNNRL